MLRPSIILNAGDRRALEDFLRTTPAELRTAQRRALNKAVTQGRNQISREVPLNLPAKRKKRDLFALRASNTSLEASVNARDIPPLLTSFKGMSETRGRVSNTAGGGQRITRRAGSQGLKVKVFTNKPPVVYPHGFIMRHANATRGVSAHRAPVGAERWKVHGFYDGDIPPGQRFRPEELTGRLPIWLLAGPSVADEFDSRIGKFEEKLVTLYDRKITQEIRFILSKRRG